MNKFIPRSLFNQPSRLLVFIGAAALFQTAQAQFPLPLHEPFPASYTNGGAGIAVPQGGANFPAVNLSAGATATKWSFGGGAGGGSAQVVGGAASLTYPNFATNITPTVGLYIRTNRPTANRSRGMLFTQNFSGNVYVSFLLNVEKGPNPEAGDPNRVFAALSSLNTGNPAQASTGLGIGLDPSTNLFLTQNSFTTPLTTMPTPLSPGTHLVVARYAFVPELTGDQVSLWVDPTALEATEENVPAPDITGSSGGLQNTIQSFYIVHPQSGLGVTNPVSLFMDEIRVGTNWASVTPTGVVCSPASIITEPLDDIVTEGIAANFSLVAGGAGPTFQWQVSTNGGTSWNNITNGTGATTPSFSTIPLSLADNGNQYRSIVNVACGGGSSATSAVVTVTVNAATATPLGVVVDDRFQDFSRQDPPVAISNSVWFATTGANLDASSGTNMVGIPSEGSALWLAYFTEDPATPVHLEVGKMIKASLVFSASNIVSTPGNTMRLGLYDYADGGSRLVADGAGGSAGNGANVLGYMLVLNFGTTFGDNTPLSLHVRNNLSSGNLMGTTGDYAPLGAGPANGTLLNAPSFQNDVPYTLEFSVTRRTFSSADVTVRISGGGSNWTHTVTDNAFAYPRFDAFGIRPNTLASTADRFDFSQFRVEVLPAAAAPINPFNITAVRLVSPNTVSLTWDSISGVNYRIESRGLLGGGTWLSNATVQAAGASTSFTNSSPGVSQQYFRVVAQ